ncbi:hypothetical protein BVRB_8g200660 isoform C [Beta vulgaris subsp. vulgaris]|uniref:Uncharacterized protein n=1 Tax=Beta vulgaris subsp. vulgaris TaxID=3555 RepID=A0A0J8B609_BETVV|nr:hypothetical protein BVRB_8g200660 isoform C [Beta vulgaris subsp. vulgaris]
MVQWLLMNSFEQLYVSVSQMRNCSSISNRWNWQDRLRKQVFLLLLSMEEEFRINQGILQSGMRLLMHQSKTEEALDPLQNVKAQEES